VEKVQKPKNSVQYNAGLSCRVLMLMPVKVTAFLDVLSHRLPPSVYFPLKSEEVGSSVGKIPSQNMQIVIEVLLRSII
jgi:hypothetical protein